LPYVPVGRHGLAYQASAPNLTIQINQPSLIDMLPIIPYDVDSYYFEATVLHKMSAPFLFPPLGGVFRGLFD